MKCILKRMNVTDSQKWGFIGISVSYEVDEADEYAEANATRLSHEDVFSRLRRQVNE